MKPDGYLPCDSVVADPVDDGLNSLHLLSAIHLLPHGGIGDSALRVADLPENRFLDSARGKRFDGTRCPAFALRVQTHIVWIPAIVLPRIRIHHPRRAGFAI